MTNRVTSEAITSLLIDIGKLRHHQDRTDLEIRALKNRDDQDILGVMITLLCFVTQGQVHQAFMVNMLDWCAHFFTIREQTPNVKKAQEMLSQLRDRFNEEVNSGAVNLSREELANHLESIAPPWTKRLIEMARSWSYDDTMGHDAFYWHEVFAASPQPVQMETPLESTASTPE